MSQAKYASNKKIDSVFVCCKTDKSSKLERQESMNEQAGIANWLKLDSGRSLFLSATATLIQTTSSFAGEDVALKRDLGVQP